MTRAQNHWLYPYRPLDVAAWLRSIGSPRADDMPQFAALVSEAAEQWDLNPRWLLMLAQKEQSFLTRPPGGAGWQRALDYTLGYGATDSRDMPHYMGVETQVRSAARGLRGYLTPTHSLYVGGMVGKRLAFRDGTYAPENLAEAAALRYTPWLYALRDLVRIWTQWWPAEAEEDPPMSTGPTRDDVVRIAREVVTARLAGRSTYAAHGRTFNLTRGGMCSRFVRQVCEAVGGVRDHGLGSGSGGPFACCASATEVNLRGAGKQVSAGAGTIVCFNSPPAGGRCGTCGRVVGHIGIDLGGGAVAENTSSASRGNPRAAGTKISGLAEIGAGRVSGYYALFPAAQAVPHPYAKGPLTVKLLDRPFPGELRGGVSYVTLPVRELERWGGEVFDRIGEQRTVYVYYREGLAPLLTCSDA